MTHSPAEPDRSAPETRTAGSPCQPSEAPRAWLTRAEVLLFCLASVIPASIWIARGGGPGFSNDSYQYLSVAENIAARGELSTSIIHFDVERSAGVVPGPSTTFPPGYPILAAGLILLGLRAEIAATLVSAIALVALIPLTLRAARSLDLTPDAARLVLVCLIGNAWAAEYAGRIGSEAAFTALAVAGVGALLEHERGRGGARGLVLGATLLGLAYWVRYAGLLLIAGVALFYGGRLAIRRTRHTLAPLAALGASGLLIGAGMLRNTLLTGSWEGGNTKEVHHPILPVLTELARSALHLLVGDAAPLRHAPAAAALALLLPAAALAIAAARARRAGRWTAAPDEAQAPLRLLLTCVAVYTVAMIYLGTSSVISFETRMFYPVLPLILLALGAWLSRALRAIPARAAEGIVLRASVATLLTTCLLMNARHLVRERPPAAHQRVEARLAAALPDGRPLRAWIEESVPPGSVIVATDAQATAFALKRRAVSLVEAEYSDQSWTEAAVRGVMMTYGADHLMLYPGAGPRAPAQEESDFLRGLLRGEVPPWLTLAAENGQAKVFRLAR